MNWALAVTIFAVILEVGVRVVFAFIVGPSVLAYGTSLHQREMAQDLNRTVSLHDNQLAGYSKYQPNQTRYDYDKDSGERFSVKINSRGFRGEDFANEKAAGVIRVVTLGASSTFGYYNRDETTYPRYLEVALARRCGPDRSVEVINLGVPHLKSQEILALFRAEGLALKPDVVTFYEGVNDSDIQKGIRGSVKRVAFLQTIYFAARDHLLTVAFISSFFDNKTRTYTAEEAEWHRLGRSEHFLKNVSDLRDVVREHGILFVVATQQAGTGLRKREEIRGVSYAQEVQEIRATLAATGHIRYQEARFLTHNEIMRDLRAWTEAEGVLRADVIEAMDNRRDHLLSWVHLTPGGNRIVADTIANTIAAQLCPKPADSNK